MSDVGSQNHSMFGQHLKRPRTLKLDCVVCLTPFEKDEKYLVCYICFGRQHDHHSPLSPQTENDALDKKIQFISFVARAKLTYREIRIGER